jgi:hypothetical protein
MRMYFVRTEESIEAAYASLERKKSVRRWAYVGANPWEHLAFGISDDERIEVLGELGYDVADIDEATNIIHGELFADNTPEMEERIISVLRLTKLENGGYAQFLDGLCALEVFEKEPRPEDVSEKLDGELLAYLVCYEGEAVGVDPDEGWYLFSPSRIVWTHETGSNITRKKNI